MKAALQYVVLSTTVLLVSACEHEPSCAQRCEDFITQSLTVQQCKDSLCCTTGTFVPKKLHVLKQETPVDPDPAPVPIPGCDYDAFDVCNDDYSDNFDYYARDICVKKSGCLPDPSPKEYDGGKTSIFCDLPAYKKC